jgi:osmotically-inducible protein OsmY
MRTDAEIGKDVKEELMWDPMLIASEINIIVKHGIVTLSGYVNAYNKRLAAENATWKVRGVRAVAEELKVQLTAEEGISDIEIAENILTAFKLNTYIPEEKIHITVTDGWIKFSGELDWNFEKDQAFNTIINLKGIKGYTNQVTVKPRITNSVVVDQIRKALDRSGDFEASKIVVESEGTKVILKGLVRSRLEKLAVEKAVWLTPGVSMLENHLEIL